MNSVRRTMVAAAMSLLLGCEEEVRTVSPDAAMVDLAMTRVDLMQRPDMGPIRGCPRCTREKVGMPTWEVADLTIIAAPTGTLDDSYSLLFRTMASILQPRHGMEKDRIRIVPLTPHPPPYVSEFTGLVDAAGFVRTDLFEATDLAMPRGLVTMLMFLPAQGSETGSSPDYAIGPIVANRLFPIATRSEHLFEGAIQTSADGLISGYPDYSPPLLFDGMSHHLALGGGLTAKEDGVNRPGEHVVRLSFLDSSQAGWVVNFVFSVR